MCLLRYFQHSRKKYTQRTSEAESRNFFLVPRKCLCEERTRCNERPTDRPIRAYERKRVEVIEVVPKDGMGNGRDHAAFLRRFRNEAKMQLVDDAVATCCRKSHDNGQFGLPYRRHEPRDKTSFGSPGGR